MRTDRNWSGVAISTESRGSGTDSTREDTRARSRSSRESASTSLIPALSPPVTIVSTSLDPRQEDPGGDVGRLAVGLTGLVGPTPGKALLRPPTGLRPALDVPRADLGLDQLPVVEDADAVPAATDQQHADGSRAGDMFHQVRSGVQRRKRNLDRSRRSVGAVEREKVASPAQAGRRRAVTFGEAGEPPGEALGRHLDGARPRAVGHRFRLGGGIRTWTNPQTGAPIERVSERVRPGDKSGVRGFGCWLWISRPLSTE